MSPEATQPTGDPAQLETRVSQLLNDIRNTLLGVQVLLAGLVAVPFAPRFAALAPTDKNLYLGAVLAAVTSSTLLVAPGQYHRLRWHHDPRPETLRIGRHLATAGSVSLALAVLALLALLTRAVNSDMAVPVVLGATVLIATLWYGLPLSSSHRSSRGDT